MSFARNTEHIVTIPVPADGVSLQGDLFLPGDVQGIVVFAHGSGSSRFSPRNRTVARHFNDFSLGTLLFDLLTHSEESIDSYTTALRFDIELLSRRLSSATDWVTDHPELNRLPCGYFGASTGAAAALNASVKHHQIKAVVSRGGRPDLAEQSLPLVTAATLLIVGGKDDEVVEINQTAMKMLGATVKRLEIVPGATHLFEETGVLETVARIATDWFIHHLR